MSAVLDILSPLLIFCFLNTYTVKLSKKGFGYSIPLAMMFSAFAVYISRFVFESFIPGFVLVFVLALGGIAFLLYEIVLKKDAEFCKNYFSKGFYAFLAVFIFFAITDMGQHFSAFDEFTHWGKMLKEMFRTDRFYSESPLLLTHHDYPPFMQLFEYVWCRLAGNLSEQNMNMSVHIFEFGLIVPIMTELTGKADKKAYRSIGTAIGILFFCLLSAVLLDEEKVFDSVYLDALVPMMFVYIVVLMDTAEKGKKFYIIAAAFSCACFVLVKQISIFFFGLALLFFVINCFVEDNKKITKHMVLNTLFIAASAGVSFTMWKLYIRSLGISGQFEAGRIPALVILAKNGWEGTGLVLDTMGRYIRSLFMLGVTNGAFSLSPFGLFVLMLVLLYFVCRFFDLKKAFVKYAVLFVIGSLGYAAALCLLYMTCFSEAEMHRLASFGRYMGSYFIGELFLIFYIFVKNMPQKGRLSFGKALTVLVCVGILCFDPADMGFLVPSFFFGEPMEEYRLTAGDIEKYADEGSKVFVINNGGGKDIYYINYYLNNCSVDSNDLYEGLFADNGEDREYWTNVLERICENDYVYVGETCENVDMYIGAYTAEGKLQSHALYKVVTGEGALGLMLCGQ